VVHNSAGKVLHNNFADARSKAVAWVETLLEVFAPVDLPVADLGLGPEVAEAAVDTVEA